MSPRVREARDDRDWRVVDSERPAFAATSVMLYGNMEIWNWVNKHITYHKWK